MPPDSLPRRAPPDLLGARSAADVRERFLREALSRVPAAHVVEAHVFAPMRRGGVESGVAVLAARRGPGLTAPNDPAPNGPVPDDVKSEVALAPDAPARHVVYVARYRLTVKGPDRGRWDVAVREEADAPLLTVDVVVRGVGERAGDAGDPVRLDAEALAGLRPPATPEPLPLDALVPG